MRIGFSRHSNGHGRGRNAIKDVLHDLISAQIVSSSTRRDLVGEHPREKFVKLLFPLDEIRNLDDGR